VKSQKPTLEAAVADWIATASYRDLLRVVCEGLSRRPDRMDDAAHVYVVGLASAANDGGGWEVAMAAEADDAAYGGAPPEGEPWCQFGACPVCHLQLTGATKRVVCPACGASAYLT
jgi:hypothetical protein